MVMSLGWGHHHMVMSLGWGHHHSLPRGGGLVYQEIECHINGDAQPLGHHHYNGDAQPLGHHHYVAFNFLVYDPPPLGKEW